jgi:hypothetical protein
LADSGRTRSQQALTIPLSDERSLRVLRESDTDELYAVIEQNRSHLAPWLPWPTGETPEERAPLRARDAPRALRDAKQLLA